MGMRVYIHGNCQAPAIATLIGHQFPEWDIASYEVFADKIIEQLDRYHNYVQMADIVICQPVHDGYRQRSDLSLSWVRQTCRPDAQFIIFPSMFFNGQLVGCYSTKIPAYGMRYHDALLVSFVAAGIDLATITRLLLADDLYSDTFVESEIALSIAEMRRRELVDNIDVPISPFLKSYGSITQIFSIVNHPRRPALVYQANQILSYLGYPASIPAVGPELLCFPNIPCLPSVERFMQIRGGGPSEWHFEGADLYHFPDKNLTRSEYIAAYYEHLSQLSHAELLQSLDDPGFRSFLQRVAADNPVLPGIQLWQDKASLEDG